MLARTILAGLCLAPCLALAQSTQALFHIERSKNKNEVHYDARLGTDGQLDAREPVVVYWRAPDGRRWPPGWVDRRYFYGFAIRKDKSGAFWHMKLAPSQARPMKVYVKDGKARAEGIIAGRRAYLQKLYVRFTEGTLLPGVRYVDLWGVDVATGAPLTERVEL